MADWIRATRVLDSGEKDTEIGIAGGPEKGP